jgi:L-threonylcarbamoyladenylate synthase
MFKTIIGSDVSHAAELLRQDEVVAIPTETVYGLAANALSEDAVEKVFGLKQRPLHHPLIVHVDSVDTMSQFVSEIPTAAYMLLQKFAPGPITLLLRTNGRIPGVVNNHKSLMAFRIPAHETALALLRSVDFPLVAPSANRFTAVSPTNPWHVLKGFDGRIPYILNGSNCRIGIESTVVGFDDGTPVIYRQGAITASQVERVVGEVKFYDGKSGTVSPGAHPLHYSPSTPLRVVDDIQTIHQQYNLDRVALLCFNRYNYDVSIQRQFILSGTGDVVEAARNFYKAMHFLDDLRMDMIIAEKLPNIGVGIALNDRLERAAHSMREQLTVN